MKLKRENLLSNIRMQIYDLQRKLAWFITQGMFKPDIK